MNEREREGNRARRDSGQLEERVEEDEDGRNLEDTISNQHGRHPDASAI